jgi:hypothetical protein
MKVALCLDCAGHGWAAWCETGGSGAFVLDGTATPDLMDGAGSDSSMRHVSFLCGEGAAQPGDEFAGADAFVKAEIRSAGVDPADDSVFVG